MTENIKIISKKEFLKLHKKIPNQEEVWDEISDLWQEFKKKPFFNVEDFLKNKKGLIIDLGCGTGRNMVKNENVVYYGVDFSGEQIENGKKIVKEKGINAKFFKMNAYDLDKNIFKNEMFDCGLFIATLHCIDDKKKRENALEEFYRVLKKGREGLISVWNSSDARFNGLIGDIYMSWKKDGKEYYRYYYLYSEEELINLLEKTGFKVLEIKTNLDKKDSKIIASSEKDRFSKKNLIVRVRK